MDKKSKKNVEQKRTLKKDKAPLLKKKVVKKVENNFEEEDFIKPININDMGDTTEVQIPQEEEQKNNMEQKNKKRMVIKKKKGKKIGWKIFRIFLFVMIALCIIGGGIAFGVLTGIIEDTSEVTLEDMILKENSTLYSSDGQVIAQLKGTENREIVQYKDLPSYVVDAVTSIEDERFFTHNGVDIKRTAAAIFNYVIHFGKSDFGGSTITQQLVKNTTDDKEASWTRKIREWYRAISLEKIMKKEDIMEQYLNTIYMGDNAYGIEKAAENYFGKRINDVNLAEAACLAAIIQLPSTYNPYNGDESRALLIERQKLVLSQMLKLGKISQEQYDEAVAYELKFTKDYQDDNKVSVLSYFADAVVDAVAKDLAESKGITYNAAIQLLYTAGYQIYTTQDLNVQSAIDSAYSNGKIFYYDRDGMFMDSAMVVMDHTNGNVVGLIGSALPKTTDRAWGGATQSKYQPGSTMKPIFAYGPAFELGVAAPGTGVDDSYFSAPGWTPTNWYNSYYGYVTCREAIAKSMNIPAIRTAQKAGVDYCWNFARNCGLKSLVDKDKSLSSAIGGLEYGVSVLELCNAYATIANGGVYVEPKLYTKVTDKEGNVILTKESEVKRVMKDSTAYMITSCLQSVVSPGGTAYGYVRVPNIAVAGKTGETDSAKDQWFAGFTPYYTIACWNGYAKHEKVISRGYPYPSVSLFNTVMNSICNGKPAASFTQPSSVIRATVCNVSGLVATDACKTEVRGNRENNDLFASGSVPTATCTIHKTAKICGITGKLASEWCKNTSDKSYITRDNPNLSIKTSDWGAMLPTETCDTCKKLAEEEERKRQEEEAEKKRKEEEEKRRKEEEEKRRKEEEEKKNEDNKVNIYGNSSANTKK